MGDRKVSIILIVLIALAISPILGSNAFALDYKKHVTVEDLGLLQLAAHDLFNVDRCDGTPECPSVEHEDGLLNLSTLFEDTTKEPDTPFTCSGLIEMGGEQRNRENIMLNTVASDLGKKYCALLDDNVDPDIAKDMIVDEYHIKLAETYQRAFGEPFPPMDDSFNSINDRFQQNLALRTVHDFIPGKIKIDNKWVSTLDLTLHGKTLDEKELKQKSSKLDGTIDDEFIDVEICFSPTGPCITVDLLEADRSFGEQFKDKHQVDESFDSFLEELEDGLYDEDDRVLFHIRNIMGMGQNFPDYS
jgi:hypothetical protein